MIVLHRSRVMVCISWYIRVVSIDSVLFTLRYVKIRWCYQKEALCALTFSGVDVLVTFPHPVPLTTTQGSFIVCSPLALSSPRTVPVDTGGTARLLL